jgi:RNA polymerase sigma-54 factor
MKTGLQLVLGQQLTLTPQLQQAIRLLQLSTIDLVQEIQQRLETNPFLELSTTDSDDAEGQSDDVSVEEDEFDLLHCSSQPSLQKKSALSMQDANLENLYSTADNLQSILIWQLELSSLSEIDKIIGRTLIDAINQDGFLTQSLTDIHDTLSNSGTEVDMDEIEAVRHLIQHFDPIGCGSLDIKDSLLLQLSMQPLNTPDIISAKIIVEDYLDDLAHRQFKRIKQRLHLSDDALSAAVKTIQGLNPRPGSLIHSASTDYIIPDVTVRKINNQWQISLNEENLPKLNINQTYAKLIKRANQSDDNVFLKHHLQDAKWFLKSLESRQDTLYQVAKAIVERQTLFLEQGESFMKPLVLKDIADELGVHESTISRITTQKYMLTPRGVFELKFFFSSNLSTHSGEDC